MTPEAPLIPTIRRGRPDFSAIATSLNFTVSTYLRSKPRWRVAGRLTGVTTDGCHRLAGGPCMTLQDRIEALKQKHAALERALDEENKRPLPNQGAIYDLKRQKLRIKDEIFQLERH